MDDWPSSELAVPGGFVVATPDAFPAAFDVPANIFLANEAPELDTASLRKKSELVCQTFTDSTCRTQREESQLCPPGPDGGGRAGDAELMESVRKRLSQRVLSKGFLAPRQRKRSKANRLSETQEGPKVGISKSEPEVVLQKTDWIQPRRQGHAHRSYQKAKLRSLRHYLGLLRMRTLTQPRS